LTTNQDLGPLLADLQAQHGDPDDENQA